MKTVKYYIGTLLLISFFFYSNVYAGKYFRDLHGDQKVFLAKSCVSIEDFRAMCYSWSARSSAHDSSYFEEKRLLIIPDTALFRKQNNAPFDIRRIVWNKRDIREYDRLSRESRKLPMTAITYEQANLYIELAEKLHVFNNPDNPICSYSLPTLKDYEIALKKNILTNGAEYLADGTIVIIDTKNKKLKVVTSTSMAVGFRLVRKINNY